LAERIRKDGSFGSKRAMCSAEKPSEADRDSYGRIGLTFDGVAQCLPKGTGRLPCGIGSGIGDLKGGIRYFICDASGLLFGISHSVVEISGRGLRHVACSARIGVVWCQRANVSESSLPGTFACAGASAVCLTGQPLRLSTVSALTNCVIARISKADITRVIHKEPAFAELFISHLLARNSRVEEDLVDQLFNSSEKRLARILLLLANFGKEGRPEPIIAKISQDTLAEMIGTTRSRVSFFLNKFRELGLIDYNGHIEVHSSLLNVVLHDQPQLRR
jgi:Crp-like helix-turn-helix domain